MKLADLNIVKTNQEIETIKSDVDTIKSQLNELLVCLPDREKKILDAIAEGKQTDLSTADIIETQKQAIAKQDESIAKLEELNCQKAAVLTGMGKWVVLLVLGILSLSVRYELDYLPGRGTVIKPDEDAGLVLPAVYTLAIIAIATGNDAKVGSILEHVGRKLGG